LRVLFHCQLLAILLAVVAASLSILVILKHHPPARSVSSVPALHSRNPSSS